MCDKKNPPINAVLATATHEQPVTIFIEDDAVTIKVGGLTATQVRLAKGGNVLAAVWTGLGAPAYQEAVGKAKKKE